MRNTVTFKYPAKYVVAPASDDVLSIEGADWFVDILRQIPALEVNVDLVQEDWGVGVLARRDGKRFWIGLSALDLNEWVAHIHHSAFVQRFTSKGREARCDLARELDRVLRLMGASSMQWFDERDAALQEPSASPSQG